MKSASSTIDAAPADEFVAAPDVSPTLTCREMSTLAPAPRATPTDLPAPKCGRRVGQLLAWWALLGVVTAVLWQTDLTQDYKNTALMVTLGLAAGGLAVWLVRTSDWSKPLRWSLAALVVAVSLAATPVGPIKLELNGNMAVTGWRWRWAPPQDAALAKSVAQSEQRLAIKTTDRDYPRFLGNGYWAEAKGIELDSNWEAHPPKLLWKQPIGAGWSAFSIVGDYAFTQEQRGTQEMVVCYELKTGQIAWSHADDVRWDPSGPGALGGVGPRATPTVYDGRVYTHGATGILNCLDAATGRTIWSHDTLAEYGAENISWGKSDSPLIVDEAVVISVGGLNENSLVAFDRETGEEVWAAGSRRSSYASPVLTELAGVRQILVVNENFVTAHDAANGKVLWEHPWDGDSNGNASASQPVPVGGDRVFLSKGYGIQSQLVQVAFDPQAPIDKQWSAEIVWQKPVLRTKLGNVVIRDGAIFGIDDEDMDCADLETGKRRWKKRRLPKLGHGQIMLVGDKIVVISEEGELILLAADGKKFRELRSIPAIEGVTWNNLAISGPYLLVRNAQEAACFELPMAPLPPLQ